jgi:hypothetical protein
MRAFFNLPISGCKVMFITLYSLITLPALSQNTSIKCNNNAIDTSIYEETLAGELFTFNEIYPGVNYFNDNWLTGNIILENGKTIYNKAINYHLITQKLVWKRPSDKLRITIDKNIVKEFTLKTDSGSEALFKKIKIQSTESFLQVLSQGYFNLFAFRKVVIGKNSQTAYPAPEYYFNIENVENQRIKLSRASLYSAVKENKKLMKKIVKSNHLRIRREAGLIKAVYLFNQEIRLQSQK